MHKYLLFLLSSLLLLFTTCSPKRDIDPRPGTVIIGVTGDIDSFNPLFSTSLTAGQINDLLYPSLIHSSFDFSEGTIHYHPSLAKSWEFRNDNRDIIFNLRTDATWEDGTTITARDVKVSYELYGNPEIGSVRQGVLDGFRKKADGSPDITNSINILNDSTIVFRFDEYYPGQLFDSGLSIMPAHIFGEIPVEELRTHPINRDPIGAGPFSLDSWIPQQEVVLRPNTTSVLPEPAKLSRLIFRIIPDYQSQLTQLELGEIDMIDNVSIDDIGRLENAKPDLHIFSVPARRYFLVGWNNIDPEAYERSGGTDIRPHPLFGTPEVRNALTLAINRFEMAEAFFGEHATVAKSPVPPLFQWAYNDELDPLPFDPQHSVTLLAQQRWRDTDGSGILRKENRRFAFSMYIPVGDHLRSTMANVIQEQLRQIKIDARIETVEGAVFFQNLVRKRYDAWIVGFTSPLELYLEDLWGSDLTASPFNFVSFQNNRVDEILSITKRIQNPYEAAPYWKELQEIFHREQPATFLFWVNNIVAVNDRVRGKRIDIHGITHNAWDWYTSTPE